MFNLNSVKHLGFKLQTDNSFTRDIKQKRGQLIAKIQSLYQEFHYADKSVMIKLYSFYICMIMDAVFMDLIYRIYSLIILSESILHRIQLFEFYSNYPIPLIFY